MRPQTQALIAVIATTLAGYLLSVSFQALALTRLEAGALAILVGSSLFLLGTWLGRPR